MILTINQDLKDFNTFGVSALADYAYEILDEQDLLDLISSGLENPLIIGGGSNILLTQSNISNPVILNRIEGISVIEENDTEVIVSVGSGVNWHEFVLWTVKNNYSGLENLSLIPGNVGAAPIQNIGAYGVEQEKSFVNLTAFDLSTGESKLFTHEDCAFGYRDSVFKRRAKGKYCITRVSYKLSKIFKPILQYKDVVNRVAELGETPTMELVSDVIIDIRRNKLPYPEEIGNAGSFFKNPIVASYKLNELQKRFPDIVAYPVGENHYKLAAAWLIDQCGFKGSRYGNVGSYKNQALVIVNYGGATGEEIVNYSEKVQATVLEKFNVEIEPEVNFY